MNKRETAQMEAMCLFISNLYASVGLEIPEDFNPDEESMIIFNACREIGKKDLAIALLACEKDKNEKANLESHLQQISQP